MNCDARNTTPTHSSHSSGEPRRRPMNRSKTRFRSLILALVVLATLLPAAAARADYEQVGHFAESGNGEQFWNFVTGAAVNTTGVGGVEPGSVYASTTERVSRYNAKGEIKEVWG